MDYNRTGETVSGLQLLSEFDDRFTAGGYRSAVVAGLSGNDVFETQSTGGTFAWSTFSGGQGDDRLIVKDTDTLVGTTIYNGDSGIDTLELTTNTQFTMVADANGTNISFGGTGGSIFASDVERFVVRGSALSDTLVGGAGNDFLDGRGGLDAFFGSAGDDGYVFDTVGERVVGELAGGGKDQIFTTVSVDLRDNANVENLRLTAGDIDGTGNEMANLITGSAGSNIIAGGAGVDTLYGKGGSDTFAFSEMGAANRDSVWDYDSDDRIQLDGTVFAGLDSNGDNVLDAAALTIGTRAVGTGAQVIYNANTGVLSYDSDGAGGVAAQDIAFIGKKLAFVDHTDFLIG